MMKTITNRTYLWTEENVGKIMEAMRPPEASLWNIRDWRPKDEGLSVMHSHGTEHGRRTSLLGFNEDRLYVAGFVLEGSTIGYYGNVIKETLREGERPRQGRHRPELHRGGHEVNAEGACKDHRTTTEQLL